MSSDSESAEEELTPQQMLLIDMQRYSTELLIMRQERHEVGQEKYGKFTFLENDMFTMVFEEIADSMNYMEYQYIKFRLLQDAIKAELDKATDDGSRKLGNFKAGGI